MDFYVNDCGFEVNEFNRFQVYAAKRNESAHLLPSPFSVSSEHFKSLLLPIRDMLALVEKPCELIKDTLQLQGGRKVLLLL